MVESQQAVTIYFIDTQNFKQKKSEQLAIDIRHSYMYLIREVKGNQLYLLLLIDFSFRPGKLYNVHNARIKNLHFVCFESNAKQIRLVCKL